MQIRRILLWMTLVAAFGWGSTAAALGSAGPFVWYDWSAQDDPFWKYMNEQTTARFGRELSPVTVGFNEMESKFPIAVAGGVSMDIVQVPYHVAREWTEAGLLLPLSERLKQGGPRVGDFIPGSFDPVSMDGQIYGIPTTTDFRVFLLNVDLWESAGLDVGVTDNWDWPTFLRAAQRLTVVDSTGNVTQAGYAAPANQGTWWGFLFANGGRFFNDGETAAAFNSTAGVEALTFLHQLYGQYSLLNTRLTSRSDFQNNRSGIFDNTPFGEHVVLQGRPDMRIKFAVYPKGPRGQHPSTRVWHNYHAIPATTKGPEAAWQLLSWYVSPTERATSAQLFGTLRSPLIPFYRTRAWRDMIATYPQRSAWPQLIQLGQLQPTRAASRWSGDVDRLISRAIAGEIAPAAALEQAETIVNAALKGQR